MSREQNGKPPGVIKESIFKTGTPKEIEEWRKSFDAVLHTWNDQPSSEMGEEELNALIDEEVAAVRQEMWEERQRAENARAA